MPKAVEGSRPVEHGADTQSTGQAGLIRGACLVLGVAVVVDGLVLAVLAFAGNPGVGVRVAEVAFGLVVAVPGLLIARAGMTGRPVRLGILLPELVLAGALLTLGVTMPIFHDGAVGYQVAVSQFALVLAALALGSAGLVLSGITAPTAERDGRLSFPGAVRDGVLLIVGTILLAIALGQLGAPKIMPPMWNWISFLGITIPGMLILVAREVVKQAARRREHAALGAVGRALVIEGMLVGGLFVMIFGSAANLTLGKNGYTTGFQGNAAGLTLVVAAAVFLVVVRGALKSVMGNQRGTATSFVALSKIGYVVGVVALIYGLRSVVMGKAPMFMTGGAAGYAAVILAVALLILVVGRAAAQARALA
jgi:hypothetical protein